MTETASPATRRPAAPARRAVALAVFGALLAGCSIDYHVAGSFDNANEVFRGTIRHDLLAGEADVVATGQNSGIVCRGRSRTTHVPLLAIGCGGQRGTVDMTCDDGRRLDVDWVAESCSRGTGRGADAYGNRFSFAFGLDGAEAEAYVARRLPETGQRPALRGFAPAGMVAASGPASVSGKADRPNARAGAPDFAVIPVALRFRRGEPRQDDVAVIIANASYASHGGAIPDVLPAYADAEGVRLYVTEAMGVPEGNVVLVRDATAAEMAYIFGTRQNPVGKLAEWVKPGKSRVHVYFAGHGAPGDTSGRSFLLPVDADGSMIAVKGYPLDVLYRNLAKLPAVSVSLVIEAGFSGISEGGAVVNKLLPGQRPAVTPVPPGLSVAMAGAPAQVASWTRDGSHSLFTQYFLTGMSGAADRIPFGDGGGTIEWAEVDAFLQATVGRIVRERYGRRQSPVIAAARG